jgi:Starch-binding associating with outer membrane
MKKIFVIFLLSSLLLVLNACRDFEDLEENPNRPASVPPSLVLRGVLSDMHERPWTLEHRQNQFWACNYNYYGTNEYWTTAGFNYLTLKNVMKMEEEAAKSGTIVNPYTAIGKFVRAVLVTRMSNKVGDIPLTDALKGLEVPEPTYNSQKDAMIQVLEWLEESNAEFKALIAENNLSLDGDIYFQNDLVKWRKAVNTFKIRVLVSLSKKENDTDLNIKQKFQSVLSNPAEYPVMSSNQDNMNYAYNGAQQIYPTNPGNRGFDKGRYNMADTYVKGLTNLNDPRVYVTCNPAKAKVTGSGALNPADFNAYIGAPSGESLDDMTLKAGNGQYSFANQKRYYTTLTGPEPSVQLSYWELCFNIAEGINRGWATGSAATYYENGIRASMAFYGISDGTVLSITESDNDAVIGTVTASLSSYLAQVAVAYAGNNATGLNQILTQKYLAFFQNSGQEAYFNYRRTGVPAFHAGPGTGNSGVIPRRWLYPQNESFYNNTNLQAALSSQFGSAIDDLDNEIWINK